MQELPCDLPDYVIWRDLHEQLPAQNSKLSAVATAKKPLVVFAGKSNRPLSF